MRLPSFLSPRLPVILAAGLLAACGGAVALQIPISGSQTVSINFSGGSPMHAENDDIKIEKAMLILDNKTKQASYAFAFRVKSRDDHPTYVKVEDVTDDNPVTWVEDNHPELKDGVWSWQSPRFTLDDNNSKWLFELENSIPIYRFTIGTARGQAWTLYEGASYPGFVKTYIRQQSGLEPAPAK